MKGVPHNNDLLEQYFRVPGRSRYSYQQPVAMDLVPGLIHPVTSIPVIPNGRYTIDLTALVQSFAAKSPLLGGFTLRLYAFSCPDRLYVPELRENWTALSYSETNDADDTFLQAQYPVVQVPPLFQTTKTVNAMNSGYGATLAPGSIYEFTGLPTGYANRLTSSLPTESGAGVDGAVDYVVATPILQYYHIFQNYFLNSSDTEFPLIQPSSIEPIGLSKAPYHPASIRNVPTKSLNTLFAKVQGIGLLETATPGEPPRNISKWLPFGHLDSSWDTIQNKWARAMYSTYYGGLCVKSLPQDLINAYVAPQAYERAIAKSLVALSNGKLDMQSLLDGRRLYNFYTKAMYGGGRFDQFIYSEYGLDIRKNLDIPLFLRSWSIPVSIGMIVASASGAPSGSTSQRDSLFGELGGLGGGRRRGMRFKYTASEPGSLVILATVEPSLLYTDVVSPFAKKFYFADRFTPSFDRMGLQPVPQNRVSWAFKNPDFKLAAYPVGSSSIKPKFPSLKNEDAYLPVLSIQSSAEDLYCDPFSENGIGYQPSWSEYTNSYGIAKGRLATDLKYWVLSPRQDSYSSQLPAGPGEPPSYAKISLPASSMSAYFNPSDYLQSFVSDFISDSPFVALFGVDIRADIPISKTQIDKL